LARGIRVRNERFGLLFYNPRGPRLTFVHSGPWIGKEFFSGSVHLEKWLKSCFPSMSERKILQAHDRLSEVLSKLEQKGLIIEALADP
jgi:hypothetical protein